MKTPIIILLLATLVMTSCKKNKRYSMSSFQVEKAEIDLKFTYTSAKDADHFEISYTTGNDPALGTKFTTEDPNSVTKSMEELGYSDHDRYTFYIRAYKNATKSGPWSEGITLDAVPYCKSPVSITAFPIGAEFNLKWEDEDYSTFANYYNVEYGLAGFELGTGTELTTSIKSTTEISVEGGKIYDFYVREYCNSSLGMSDWKGPYSHFVEDDHNLCIAPSGVHYTIEENFFGEPFGANFTWDHNGESDFEFNVVYDGESPEVGAYTEWYHVNGTPTISLTQNTDYDFYIRVVCLDDSKTSWTGPLNVNIGD